jgi:hypothetical protein
MAIYRERIERAIEPLLNRGFAVKSVDESLKYFGNVVLVLAGPQIFVRFISDRGQQFVELATTAQPPWYSLEEL